MPDSSHAITAPVLEALIECFEATYTDDADIAGPPNVLISLYEAVQAGTPRFSLEPDGTMAFDTSHGFLVHIDLIQMGDGSDVIRTMNATNPVHGASVASKSDLLWLRAATAVERGKTSDLDDFLWLLYEIVKDGDSVPVLGKQELDLLVETGAHLGILDRLLLAAALAPIMTRVDFRFWV